MHISAKRVTPVFFGDHEVVKLNLLSSFSSIFFSFFQKVLQVFSERLVFENMVWSLQLRAFPRYSTLLLIIPKTPQGHSQMACITSGKATLVCTTQISLQKIGMISQREWIKDRYSQASPLISPYADCTSSYKLVIMFDNKHHLGFAAAIFILCSQYLCKFW